MEFLQFCSLVAQMRALQREFFRHPARNRRPDLIRRCKVLEDRVDAAIAAAGPEQQDLFAKETP